MATQTKKKGPILPTKKEAPLTPAEVKGAIQFARAYMSKYVLIPGKVDALYKSREGKHPAVRKVLDEEYRRFNENRPYVPPEKRTVK